MSELFLVGAIFVTDNFFTLGMWNTGEAGLGGGLSSSDDELGLGFWGLLGFIIGDLDFVILIG